MTTKQLIKYFENLWFLHKQKKGKDVTNLIEIAVLLGMEDFWGACPWAFKEANATVTCTANSETVELPGDFQSFISVREKDSSSGAKLQKYSSDEYDRLVPDSGSLATGTPGICKIFYDNNNGVWKLALYPTPNTATVLYLNYHTMLVDGSIPEKYYSPLMAGITKYMFLSGSAEWHYANNAFNGEVERLKRQDNPDVSPISRVLDSSDVPKFYDNSELFGIKAG